MTTKSKSAPLPILEFDGTGRHRIVISKDDGTCEACAWQPVSDTIYFGKYFSAGCDEPLPPGIFMVKEVPHQVLA